MPVRPPCWTLAWRDDAPRGSTPHGTWRSQRSATAAVIHRTGRVRTEGTMTFAAWDPSGREPSGSGRSNIETGRANNVLVTAAGRRTGLVVAFVEATHARGARTIAGDVDGLAPA